MPKASELKKSEVIEINGQPCIIKDIDVKNPSSRGASTLYKIKANNVISGQKVEINFTGDDFLKPIDVQRKSVQFLYQDGEHYTFMDGTDYAQYTLDEDQLGDAKLFMTDGSDGFAVVILEEKIVGLEVPQSVVLEVIETDPAIKGATASSRTKPATLTTGLVVQVPEYLAQGEKIKINTAQKKFISRVSE